MTPRPADRRSALLTLPRAAAAVLALLLSVLAGPRGGNDDRRADRLSDEAAQSTPIARPLAPVVQTVARGMSLAASGDVDLVARIAPVAVVSVTAHPLRDTPIAARAP